MLNYQVSEKQLETLKKCLEIYQETPIKIEQEINEEIRAEGGDALNELATAIENALAEPNKDLKFLIEDIENCDAQEKAHTGEQSLSESEKLVSMAKFTIDMAEKLELGEKYPMSLIFARAVLKQDEELSALREKYRWRKQSEEPAPSGIDILEYTVGTEILAYRVDPKKLLCRPHSDSMWRPLELPEEDA